MIHPGCAEGLRSSRLAQAEVFVASRHQRPLLSFARRLVLSRMLAHTLKEQVSESFRYLSHKPGNSGDRKGRLDRVTRMAHTLRVVRVGPADGPTISRDHRAGLLGSGPVRLTNQSEIVRSYGSGVERLAKTSHSQLKSGHLPANEAKTGQHRKSS